MVRTDLTTDVNSTNNSTYATASFAPTKDRLVLVFVMSVNSSNAAANIPTLSGNGLNWVMVQTATCRVSNDYRLSCFRAMGSAPTAGPLTFNFGGQSQSQCAWSIFEYDGLDVSAADGANAIVQANAVAPGATPVSSIGVALNPFQDKVKNLCVGGAIAANALVVGGFDQGEGFTQIHGQRVITGARQSVLETQEKVGEDTLVDWLMPTGTSAPACAIALELRVASAAIDVEALARRFEPILFFHPDEKWFPSDAKRYIENCALWRAESPIDQKDSWGGKGQPFDRTPLIAQGQIAAVQGDTGTFLGTLPPVPPGEDRFLELEGWKNKAGAPEPKVTQGSVNSYANREAIATLYNNADNAGGKAALRDSRFWYHAEAFEKDRLVRLLAGVRAPDLVKLLDGRIDPILLCYYMFYPAHEESLDAPCNNIEAREFACFAGEWACTAILIERETADGPHAPTLIGYSGRQLAAAGNAQGGLGRAIMKLSKFSATTREGEHPKLFVARRTHSLYLDPGDHNISDPGSYSLNCGRTEESTSSGGGIEFDLETAGAAGLFWLKVAVGGWGFGALGALAGLIWGIVEVEEEGEPFGIQSSDPAADDVGPTLGNLGTVIHPVGVTISDPGAKLEPWTSAQGLQIGTRRYDFLVDRQKQAWWPGDTETGGAGGGPGYRGLFGPAVAHDPNGRRRGMEFPEFWRSFFLALADGKEQKIL